MKNYYKILGVKDGASAEDIKKNYLKLAQIYHPDKNGGDDEKFKEINEAYQILSDYWKRQDYDHLNTHDSQTEFQSNQQTYTEKENIKNTQPNNRSDDKPLKMNYRGILSIVAFAVFMIIIITISFSNNDTSLNVPTNNLNGILSNKPASDNFSINNIKNAQYDQIEKCTTEYGIKICDLTYSVKKVYGDGKREIDLAANAINCVNVATGNQSQHRDDSVFIDAANTYCVSDFGDIYIDPTIEVKKYFNKILRDDYNSPYTIPVEYETCIWTYADGSGVIPYIEVSGNIGPSSGFDVKAFCKNGNNQVDIYSYQEK